MLDPQLIRTGLDEVSRKLEKRGFVLDTGTLQALEDRRKQASPVRVSWYSVAPWHHCTVR